MSESTYTAEQIAAAKRFAAACRDWNVPRGGEALRGIPQIAVKLGLVRGEFRHTACGNRAYKFLAVEG